MKIANYQFDEILEKANESADPKSVLKEAVDSNTYVKFWLNAAVDDTFISFELEDAKAEYSKYHRSMAGMYLLSSTSKRIYESVLTNSEVVTKSKLFQAKSMIEMLYEGEAKIFKAILTKNLTSLYPKLTHELICSVL